MERTDAPTRKAVEAVFRIEAARLIGSLVRFVGSIDRAEDLAQEALLRALETWPESGVPRNPGAWLVTTAKHRAIDEGRRAAMMEGKHQEIELGAPTSTAPRFEHIDQPVEDDVLRLILTACHPVLTKEARVALTLRLIAGLSTAEIARAFLSTEATIAQRIVRAKRTLTEAKVPFEIPVGQALSERIPPALEVLYLIFNEGYAATAGDDWLRPELCEEAMRLGRILVGLVPTDPEAHGLLSLMELSASRARARFAPDGSPVLLPDQDRKKWDRLLITRGLAALGHAQQLRSPMGPYALQAAISACHARAKSADLTDWAAIVALYDALTELTGSPVVELNRAVAVSMAFGPEEALPLVEELSAEPALQNYHLLEAVRGDLYLKLGRQKEASVAFRAAAELTQNAKEREFLLLRAARCQKESDSVN